MKFPVSFKPLVLAAALAVSGAASAASYTLPTDGSPVVATVNSATFDDVFNFNVSSLSSLSGGASSSGFSIVFGPYTVNVNPVTFSEIKLFKGASEVTSGFSVTGLTSSSLSFSASNLVADSYSVHIKGAASSGIGAYAVAANLAPVPEPESYAMFLAGLGIMGAVVRRRQHQA